MTYPIASDSMDRLARLLRTAGPMPAELRCKLDSLDQSISRVAAQGGCTRSVEVGAHLLVGEVESYLSTQDGVVFPTPADDPPTAHPSWSQPSAPPPG